MLDAYIVDAEEAERHDVRAPLGPGTAGAAARRDPAPVKHHRHVVRALGGHHLWGHHSGTQMETCGDSQVQSYSLGIWGKGSTSTEIRYMPLNTETICLAITSMDMDLEPPVLLSSQRTMPTH